VRFPRPVDAIVRGLWGVVVQKNGPTEWTAVSRQSAVEGELLLLHMHEHGRPRTVCVIESRPMIVDGDMRYRIRLEADAHRIVDEQVTGE
jgi:hypothetical protein